MKQVGYWKQFEDSEENLPWPTAGKLSDDVKKQVADYLDKGKLCNAWMGWSSCRICGKRNGTTCLTDGEFVYPEGYSHYIRDHDIMPDVDLLAKILGHI